MREEHVARASLFAIAFGVTGCTAILGEFTSATGNADSAAPADASVSPDGNASRDGATQADGGDANAAAASFDGSTDATVPPDSGMDAATSRDSGFDAGTVTDGAADAFAAVDGGADAPPPRDSGADSTPPADGGTGATATLSIAPLTYPFPPMVVGGQDASAGFTVTNAGPLTTGVIAASQAPGAGISASEFPTSDGCSGKSLAPDASCTISVAFAPSGTGLRTTELSVTATPGGTASATMSGTGLAPALLGVSPSSWAFPVSMVGDAGPTEVFNITNSGQVPSGPVSPGLTFNAGTANTEFAIIANTCSGGTLAASGSCSVTVQFDPATYGAKSASININGGAPLASLSGTGEDSLSLTVTKSGTGTGTVTDNTGALSCGSACTTNYLRTTTDPTVTLSETPGTTSVFGGWGGACGDAGSTCQLTLSGATTVSAQFNPIPETLSFSMTFVGSDAGADASSASTNPPSAIACNGACSTSASFPYGSTVKLTATVASGNLFHWTGACAGSSVSCSVTMNSSESVGLVVSHNNYMFVSSVSTPPNFGGTAGGDQFCQALANNAGLPGTYQALLAISGTNPIALTSRLSAVGARGWIRVDGQPFADQVADFTSGAIRTLPDIEENGSLAPSNGMWTGAAEDGTPAGADCDGFTTVDAGASANIGLDYQGEWTWYYGGGEACKETFPLFCFGVSLSNPLVYAKPPGRYAFLSKAFFNTAMGLSGGTANTTTGSADVLCQTEATDAGLPGTYLALLATTSASAASRFDAGGLPWMRPDGVPLAPTAADLMAANGYMTTLSQHADGTYENGSGLAVYARTGAFMYPDTNYPSDPLTSPASATTDTCGDWTESLAAYTGSLGLVPDPYGFFGYRGGSIGASSGYPVACGATLPIYCLQE